MIIKLTTGQRVIFTVTALVRDVPPNNPKYAAQHKFVGHTADDQDACLFMATTSAERQLGRLGLTLDTVIGQTVEFAKPGEYVDINRPNGTPAPVAVASPTTKQPFSSGPHIPGLDAEPVSTTDKLTALFNLYESCFDHVALMSKRLSSAGIPMTHEGIAAQAATLFIAAKERGCAT